MKPQPIAMVSFVLFDVFMPLPAAEVLDARQIQARTLQVAWLWFVVSFTWRRGARAP